MKVRDVTIYHVAERAQVSIATVSRVLNSPEQVNAATRARVMAVIQELGFIPKAEAIARARKDTGRIGVLAPLFTYPSFVQRLRGISEALANTRYELVIYDVDSAVRRDSYLTSLPAMRRLDGLIIMSLPCDNAAIDTLLRHGLGVVLIEGAHPQCSSVEIDDHAGGRIVGEYIVAQGHTRCAFVGDSDVPEYLLHTSDRRLLSYQQTLAAAGIELPDQYVALAPHGIEHARQQALRLFSLAMPPSAIFAPSDAQAIGVLKAARDCGLRVPDDVAVVGFDDIEVAEYIGLTTVRQHLNESGRVALELLLSQLLDSSRPTRRVQLPLTLIRRETA